MKAGHYVASRHLNRLTVSSVCFETKERADLWREFLVSEDEKKPKARRRSYIVIEVLPEVPKA